jgi:hypothetical protein
LVGLAAQIRLGLQSGSEETWLIRAALDFLRKNVKVGLGREDTIQQIAGHIYKTLRKDRPDEQAILAFATAVYDDLYLGQWKGEIPNLNRQKDWIYQFGFVYRMLSSEQLTAKKAEKIRKQLQEQNLEATLEHIADLLRQEGNGAEYYASQYHELIHNPKQ